MSDTNLGFGIVALAAAGMLACGGGSDDAGLGAAGAAGSGGSAAAGGFSGFGGSSGAAGGSAGSGTGGTTGPDMRIDPIELGHAWTYDVTITGVYPLCKAGIQTGQVLGKKDVGGKPAFQVQSLCPAAGVSSYNVEGDRVLVYYGGVWLLALDAPVQEGHSWTNGTSTFTWHKEGTVTVPAGTFDDCWTARDESGQDSYTTFCRGVGPVIWHTIEDGNGYDARLTKASF